MNLARFKVIGVYGHIIQIEYPSSSRGGMTHSIELDADSLDATCSCENFEYRISSEQNLLTGELCKHLMDVRASYNTYLAQLVARVATQENNDGREYDADTGEIL